MNEDGYLSGLMCRRIEALKAAKEVLMMPASSRGGIAAAMLGTGGKAELAGLVPESLIQVANFIVTGQGDLDYESEGDAD